MKKILFIDNTAHHLYGQIHLMQAFAALGHQIQVLVPDDGNYYNRLLQLGFECSGLKINGKSRNPFANLLLAAAIANKIHVLAPNLICSFTIKPNLYAAIAARKQQIPIIVNITGLGYVFRKTGWLHTVVVKLYRYAFKRLDYALLQNGDDQRLFAEKCIFSPGTPVEVIPGSGVNVKKFPYTGLTEKDIVFLFSGRLLWDKGLKELVAALRIVKAKYPKVRLWLLGNYFLENPNGIRHEQIAAWVKEGCLEYLGMVDNVAEVMREIDCMILPSYYREGIPRVLMEACSMGKPIITVDSVGCREVIEDGFNGFVAQPRDIQTLAGAMLKFIELPFAAKVQMGLNGRRKMEREFDQQLVINKYLAVAASLLAAK